LVGDNLYFDVTPSGDQLLHEDSRISECLESVTPRTLEPVCEFSFRTHDAYTVTTASRRRFEQKWISEPRCVALCSSDSVYGPSAPRHHRHVYLLGQDFGGDLVADPSHHVAVRSDEDNPHIPAKVREIRMFRNKPPARPNRVGLSFDQSLLQTPVVHIAALKLLGCGIHNLRRTKADGFISLAHKHGVPVRFGEQRYGAQVRPMFLIKFPGGVNKTHSGLATVYDGHTPKIVLHNASQRIR
jgi:hypothetical protein